MRAKTVLRSCVRRGRRRANLKNDLPTGGEDNEDERFDWEAGFRCLFELLTGDEKRVLEASEDWREALGAWGVWVNAGGRREDIP